MPTTQRRGTSSNEQKARWLFSLTPTALAAALNVYSSSTTSRTASRLNSSENRRRFAESGPSWWGSFVFDSLIRDSF